MKTYRFRLSLSMEEDGEENPSAEVDIKTTDFNQLKAVIKRTTAALTGWVSEREGKV